MMYSEVETTFLHKKKISFFLATSFVLSVVFTSIPLFIMKYVSIETSLMIMFFIEFSFGVSVYMVILRHFPHYKIIPERNPEFIKKTLILFILITLIQTAVFLYNISTFQTQVVNLDFLTLISLVFIIPFYEEIFYRGCLFGFVCSIYNKNLILPGIISSLTFCLMHTQYFSFLYQAILFTISSMLIYIRIKTKSLFYPIILHSGMNAFVVLLNAQSFYR